MKIAVLGAGNMGGAIVKGIIKSGLCPPEDIYCTVRSRSHAKALTESMKGAHVVAIDDVPQGNEQVAAVADVVILAVKPWLVEDVMRVTAPALRKDALLVSVVATVKCEDLRLMLHDGGGKEIPVFRVVPNTAAAVGDSITFIAQEGGDRDDLEKVKKVFEAVGEVMVVDEHLIPAMTALASCGIALAMRYVRAAMQAGVEMGVYPKDAARIVELTMRGAANLLLASGKHPEEEIDRVTTPGGLTIRGINTLDKYGFTNAVVEAHKACK